MQILFFQITTPTKSYFEYGNSKKPFYRESWFLVALAAASIVIVIMIVAVLCVKSKTYKYKGKNTQYLGLKKGLFNVNSNFLRFSCTGNQAKVQQW